MYPLTRLYARKLYRQKLIYIFFACFFTASFFYAFLISTPQMEEMLNINIGIVGRKNFPEFMMRFYVGTVGILFNVFLLTLFVCDDTFKNLCCCQYVNDFCFVGGFYQLHNSLYALGLWNLWTGSLYQNHYKISVIGYLYVSYNAWYSCTLYLYPQRMENNIFCDYLSIDRPIYIQFQYCFITKNMGWILP